MEVSFADKVEAWCLTDGPKEIKLATIDAEENVQYFKHCIQRILNVLEFGHSKAGWVCSKRAASLVDQEEWVSAGYLLYDIVILRDCMLRLLFYDVGRVMWEEVWFITPSVEEVKVLVDMYHGVLKWIGLHGEGEFKGAHDVLATISCLRGLWWNQARNNDIRATDDLSVALKLHDGVENDELGRVRVDVECLKLRGKWINRLKSWGVKFDDDMFQLDASGLQTNGNFKSRYYLQESLSVKSFCYWLSRYIKYICGVYLKNGGVCELTTMFVYLDAEYYSDGTYYVKMWRGFSGDEMHLSHPVLFNILREIVLLIDDELFYVDEIDGGIRFEINVDEMMNNVNKYDQWVPHRVMFDSGLWGGYLFQESERIDSGRVCGVYYGRTTLTKSMYKHGILGEFCENVGVGISRYWVGTDLYIQDDVFGCLRGRGGASFCPGKLDASDGGRYQLDNEWVNTHHEEGWTETCDGCSDWIHTHLDGSVERMEEKAVTVDSGKELHIVKLREFAGVHKICRDGMEYTLQGGICIRHMVRGRWRSRSWNGEVFNDKILFGTKGDGGILILSGRCVHLAYPGLRRENIVIQLMGDGGGGFGMDDTLFQGLVNGGGVMWKLDSLGQGIPGDEVIDRLGIAVLSGLRLFRNYHIFMCEQTRVRAFISATSISSSNFRPDGMVWDGSYLPRALVEEVVRKRGGAIEKEGPWSVFDQMGPVYIKDDMCFDNGVRYNREAMSLVFGCSEYTAFRAYLETQVTVNDVEREDVRGEYRCRVCKREYNCGQWVQVCRRMDELE